MTDLVGLLKVVRLPSVGDTLKRLHPSRGLVLLRYVSTGTVGRPISVWKRSRYGAKKRSSVKYSSTAVNSALRVRAWGGST
jgi:hypothetical protein